jgi:transcriptional regulator with XRE-family HTH domain
LSTFSEIWPKLKRSKRYREEFVAQHAKQAIPFQIAALMKQHGLTQEDLARSGGINQSSISRAIDPSYGNLSLNSLVRIAAGFDVAFIGRFVPFSELPKWFDRLYEEPFTVPSFGEEDAALAEASSRPSEIVAEIISVEPRTPTTAEELVGLQLAAGAQQPKSSLPVGMIVTREAASSLDTSLEQRRAQREAARSLAGTFQVATDSGYASIGTRGQ